MEFSKHAIQFSRTAETAAARVAELEAGVEIAGTYPTVEEIARVIHRADEPGELDDAPAAHQRFCRRAAAEILALFPKVTP